MTGRQITSTVLRTAQVADVLALVRAARLADGVEPLSEHVLLHLRYDSSDLTRARVLNRAVISSSPRAVTSRATPTWIPRRPIRSRPLANQP